MEPVSGQNINKPIMEVKHSELKRYGDSEYKSVCPKCEVGLLLVNRNPETMELQELDRCALCGQAVKYTDIDEMREPEDKE